MRYFLFLQVVLMFSFDVRAEVYSFFPQDTTSMMSTAVYALLCLIVCTVFITLGNYKVAIISAGCGLFLLFISPSLETVDKLLWGLGFLIAGIGSLLGIISTNDDLPCGSVSSVVDIDELTAPDMASKTTLSAVDGKRRLNIGTGERK